MSDVMDRYYKGSHTLVWEPAADPDIVNHCYDDRAMTAIEKTFGPYPITLKREDLRILRAMLWAGGHRPLDDLITLVEKHGTIRIWLISSTIDRRSIAQSRPDDRPDRAAVLD